LLEGLKGLSKVRIVTHPEVVRLLKNSNIPLLPHFEDLPGFKIILGPFASGTP
jgi:hypothetical protein